MFIRSLSKSEKRYLTIQLARNNALYGDFFSQISTQKVYNEQVLKQLFPTINFQFVKNYLFKTILKLLSEYDIKEDESQKLLSIKVLIKRGNYSEANKMLKKAIKLELKGEDYLLQLNLVKQAKILLPFYSYNDKELISIVKKEAEILKRYNNLSTYQSLYAEIIAINNTVKDVECLNSFKKHPYLNDITNATDSQCKLFYHLIRVVLGVVTSDRVFMASNLKRLISQINDAVFYDKLEDSLKFLSLRIIMVVDTFLDLDKSQLILDRFKELIDKSNTSDDAWSISNHAVYFNSQFCFYSHKNNDKTTTFLKESDLFFETNKKKLSPTILLSYNGNKIAYLFKSKRYREVIPVINDFFFNYDTDLNKDLCYSIFMIEIVSFIELNKMDVAENRLDAFIRFVKKNKPKAEIFQYYINLFNAIILDQDVSLVSKKLIKYDSINSKKGSTYLIDWAKTKEG